MLDPIWKVEVDGSTPAEWAQMLDLFNDASIYQTWSYGRVRWGEENLSHIVLKRDDEPLAIAQLRIVRPTRLKFGIAYLRWGPLCERRDRSLIPEVATAMAEALEEEYVRKRKLFLWILPNAFSDSPRAADHSFRALQVYAGAAGRRKYVSDICGGSSSIDSRIAEEPRPEVAE